MEPLKLNIEEYKDDIQELDLSPEQERELLEVLWNIMRTFVELGLGLDPIQSLFADVAEKTWQEENKIIDLNQSLNEGKES